ncbi:MAG TPA: Na+/H+ antiporter NhaA [Acidimicrobiales bacterium]|nr:Na+/H+ antiporter NhaA [Acidimicrobiales bacterium]
MAAHDSSFLRRFLHDEAAGGVALVAATVVALVWANVSHGSYEDVWHGRLDLRHWVNEGLMAVFFFVVGLEVRRELRTLRTAVLPMVAALGGMVVPAVLYLLIAGGRGWGIPMATDIAFAVGVLALLGRRVPAGLKLFLLTLAVVDDIGAVIVIALVYSEGVEPVPLLAAAAFLAAAAATGRPWPSVVLAVGVWAALLDSGVHATLAGVAAAFVVPAGQEVEERLHPWTSFVVVPVFALANAGVELDLATSKVTWGVLVGLVVGKPLGIVGASWLAVRLGQAELPRGVRWPHVVGGGALAGIGFTVSLFVAGVAFDSPEPAEAAKVAILGASVAAASLGAAVLTFWRAKN